MSSRHESHAFAVHQEADGIASWTIVRAGFVAVIVGCAGVLVAGLVLVGEVGSLRPSAMNGATAAPFSRTISNVEQTPIGVSRIGLDVKAAQQRRLGEWGWKDRDAGVATIPIERAIDVVVEEQAR